MGASESVLALLESEPDIKQCMEQFCLTTRHIDAIHKVFKSGDREITSAEFHELFVTDASSPFLYHLFDVIDVNHDQSLAFSEFLAVICTFCCYTELQMVKFAFDTFDVDGNGSIGVRELSDFIGKLDSKTGDIPKTVKRVLTMFDSNADQSIGLDEFAEMNLKYPHLLWPAFRLQYRIQEMTIGLNQWKGAIKRMKQRKDMEEGRTTARSGCLACFGGQQQRQVAPRSRSQSHDTESGGTTPSGRHGDVRKLNPDRIRRRQSGAASKKLSVMKGGRSKAHSQSMHSSNERSITSHTYNTSHTQHTHTQHAETAGHRRTTTSTSSHNNNANKSLRRNMTHATVTRGHSRGESDAVGGRSGWTSQSIAEERTDRVVMPRGSTMVAEEAMDVADMSAQSDEDSSGGEVEPARFIPKKGPSRAGTFFQQKSAVHPLDAGGGTGGGVGGGGGGTSVGERGNVSRRSSAAAVLRRGPSLSPPHSSPVNGHGLASHNTPLSPGKAQLTREKVAGAGHSVQ